MPKRKKAESEGSAPRFAKEQLQSFVERIESCLADKKEIADEIKGLYDEAGSNGYDKKALRAVIRLRAQDAAERAEHAAMVELYLDALGMLADTPLGEAAIHRLHAGAPPHVTAA